MGTYHKEEETRRRILGRLKLEELADMSYKDMRAEEDFERAEMENEGKWEG